MADWVASDKLCNASATGDVKTVVDLLKKGADVNGFNQFNRTALQVVMLGHSRLIQVLLAAGADPDLPDPRLGLTVTHDAARQGFGESVRVLVSGGADVNLLDWDGNLPLHLAAAGGHLEALRALLPRTADPGQADGWGRSPWRLAIDHQQLDAAAAISQYLDHD
ncbi:cyclin-dependent kinase 4 inhibitor C isoform X1 [Cololabis saira]|uniref:cyclin-dependent kinase 4 inhibitor C isoform X1 n=1 Tax=Cololabis saira TaxID=129043 RepID=UPI002AD5A21E|nr:cyclin-dependent kinase 4 inhibitor C isoform X1 [Cololabis saira]